MWFNLSAVQTHYLFYVHKCTCSSFFDSKGESAVTRFTAATLIPGGAEESGEEAEDCCDSAVSDSEPGVSTLGCFDALLKLTLASLRKQ